MGRDQHLPAGQPEAHINYKVTYYPAAQVCYIIFDAPNRAVRRMQAVASDGARAAQMRILFLLFGGGPGPREFPAKGPHIFHLSGEYQGDEQTDLQAIFDSDLPQRKAYVMGNCQIALTPPDWIDHFLGDLRNYIPDCPLFVQRAVETRPQQWECMVAHLDDQMLGLITICKDQMGQPYVGIMYTHKEVRQYGVASFLLKAAITFCIRGKAGPLKLESNHAYITKMLSHFPEEARSVIDWTVKGDELSVEQEQAEAKARAKKEEDD